MSRFSLFSRMPSKMSAVWKKSACLIAVVLFGSFASADLLDHHESYLESSGADSNDAKYEKRDLVESTKTHKSLQMRGANKQTSYQRKKSVALARTDPSEHRNLMMTPNGGWTFNPVVYGLLHILESGSAEINGRLSMNYERVCGAKGYSYDAYNANERFKTKVLPALRKGRKQAVSTGDIYSKIDERYNRNNVPFQYMKEIGFEDCDYVALEAEAIEWDRNFGTWFKPMELHVPCRDPLDLFMSMCDHQGIKFSCKQKFQEEVNECLIGGERFVMSQLTNDNINLKCFGAPSRHGDYLDHMAERLQRKSFSTEYIHRGPTLPRSKNGECVWKQNGKYHERLQDHLKNKTDFKYYFKFCDECMVSENNLLL
mmetsp:Transcript_44012/g.86325  ORF Transcript_44012/g.86325 Transcript_44012/m.86325 type:complete len:371 (-) Transcript_44012:65-1177(-)